jgi:hypothetical protein
METMHLILSKEEYDELKDSIDLDAYTIEPITEADDIISIHVTDVAAYALISELSKFYGIDYSNESIKLIVDSLFTEEEDYLDYITNAFTERTLNETLAKDLWNFAEELNLILDTNYYSSLPYRARIKDLLKELEDNYHVSFLYTLLDDPTKVLIESPAFVSFTSQEKRT